MTICTTHRRTHRTSSSGYFGADRSDLAEFPEVAVPLLRQIIRCVNSQHFQVMERAQRKATEV